MDIELDILFDYFKFIYLYISLLECYSKCYDDIDTETDTDLETEANNFFYKTFNLIKTKNEEKFKELTRCSVRTFDHLLNLLKEKLTKQSYRPAITTECRLAITMIYLAHGDSTNTLSTTFRTSPTSVRRIIYDTCEAIWEELHWPYVATPSASESKETARTVYSMTRLPHCVGAIDKKRINIICPSGANYKEQHSVVLLAACDARYIFTYVDIGVKNSISESIFSHILMENRIDLPNSEPLPGSDISFPYFFVADVTFPLRNNIMKPYPGRLLGEAEISYNDRISSARRLIENTFGIMCARWRIMNQTLHCSPENAEKIVQAVVTLHNFIKIHDVGYCLPDYVDHVKNGSIVPGGWRREVQPLKSSRFSSGNNAKREAFLLRDQLKVYLNSN